jgi:dynein heavy chain
MYTKRCCIYTERLKFGLLTEIKTCTHRIGQVLKKKYRREMDYVYAVINEMDRKLERPIRDLDDVRMVMDTLKKIREQEVDMELKIDPIEVYSLFVVSVFLGFGKFEFCLIIFLLQL